MAWFSADPAPANLRDNQFSRDGLPIFVHTLGCVLEFNCIAGRELARTLEKLQTGQGNQTITIDFTGITPETKSTQLQCKYKIEKTQVETRLSKEDFTSLT